MHVATLPFIAVMALIASVSATPLYPAANNTQPSSPTIPSLPPCPSFSSNGGPLTTQEIASIFRTATIPADISLLADRELIRTSLSRYALAADSHDVDTFDYVFTEDARVNFSTFGVMNGIDEIKTGLGGVVSNFAGSQHQVGTSNIQLCLSKNDHQEYGQEEQEELSAISVTYTSAAQFPMEGTVPLNVPIAELALVYAQYQDQWVRGADCDGVVSWKIKERNVLLMGPLAGTVPSGLL